MFECCVVYRLLMLTCGCRPALELIEARCLEANIAQRHRNNVVHLSPGNLPVCPQAFKIECFDERKQNHIHDWKFAK